MNAQVIRQIFAAVIAHELRSPPPADVEVIREDIVDALRRPVLVVTDASLARQYGRFNTRCSDPVYLPMWGYAPQPVVEGCA